MTDVTITTEGWDALTKRAAELEAENAKLSKRVEALTEALTRLGSDKLMGSDRDGDFYELIKRKEYAQKQLAALQQEGGQQP